MVTETMESLRGQEATAVEVLARIRTQIDAKLAKTLVRCESSVNGKGCGAGFEIRELVYIQTHWYEGPHGCTGGDNWHAGDGEFDCPTCDLRNRLYTRPDVMKLKRYFGSVVEEHTDRN